MKQQNTLEQLLAPIASPELKKHLLTEILPRYERLDSAHTTSHVCDVLQASLQYITYFPVQVEKVLVVGAYHDLGLVAGREYHHLESARILREDKALSRHFSLEEMEEMAQAVEDHRASRKEPPRTAYGLIVAEADRQLHYETVLLRTIQYSLAQYPKYSKEEHRRRCWEHIEEKYGVGGYLKLWLDFGPNHEKLQELRQRLAEPEKREMTFDCLYTVAERELQTDEFHL